MATSHSRSHPSPVSQTATRQCLPHGARTLAHHACATATATGEPRAPRVKRAGVVRACCGAGRTRSAGPCKWRAPYLGRCPFDAQVGEAARHIRAAVPDVEEDGCDVPVGQRLGPAPLPTPTRLRAHGHTCYRNTSGSTKHERGQSSSIRPRSRVCTYGAPPPPMGARVDTLTRCATDPRKDDLHPGFVAPVFSITYPGHPLRPGRSP